MEKSESITELITAISKAKLKFTPLLKTGKADFKTKGNNGNPGRQIKYDYVELENILEMATPLLAAEGIVVSQEEVLNNGTIEISTWFFHSSGEFMHWEPLALPIATGSGMSVIQSIGSTISFCRRYDLLCKLGLAGEKDTDGNDLRDAIPVKPVGDIKKPQAKKPKKESEPDIVPPIDEVMIAKRKVIIDEIAEILKNPVFDEADKEMMKRNIHESNTLELLGTWKSQCLEVEKIRSLKKEGE